jgi:hypothetical protein
MAIPSSQLETWSHQGSVTESSSTYQTIRTALTDSKAVYADKSFNVFLQGSYGNGTNIYAESDVDTVIRLDSIFRGDVRQLPADQQAAYHQAYPGSAGYTFGEFNKGVITRLTNAFGADAITQGNKAIAIKANGSRRSADVIACYQYRRYTRFKNATDNAYISGIIFPSSWSGEIINYPKLHAENLTTKQQATSKWFKPIVRIVKNMRKKMVKDGTIANDVAPSYYIEGMLYNVPNSKFGTGYGDSFVNSLNWLLETDRTKLTCANEQYWLLGTSSVQWTATKCDQFLNSLVKLWNNW